MRRSESDILRGLGLSREQVVALCAQMDPDNQQRFYRAESKLEEMREAEERAPDGDHFEI